MMNTTTYCVAGNARGASSYDPCAQEPLVGEDARRMLTTATGDDWTPVGRAAFGGVVAAIVVVVLFHLREAAWVPLLDGANLMIHEAGHPLFGIFGEDATVYGGTALQLLVPLAFAVSFWRRRQSASFALMGVWLAESLLNVARYVADAREQALPLLGGDHDWAEILWRWDLLDADQAIAKLLRWFAAVGLVATVVWLRRRPLREG